MNPIESARNDKAMTPIACQRPQSHSGINGQWHQQRVAHSYSSYQDTGLLYEDYSTVSIPCETQEPTKVFLSNYQSDAIDTSI